MNVSGVNIVRIEQQRDFALANWAAPAAEVYPFVARVSIEQSLHLRKRTTQWRFVRFNFWTLASADGFAGPQWARGLVVWLCWVRNTRIAPSVASILVSSHFDRTLVRADFGRLQ